MMKKISSLLFFLFISLFLFTFRSSHCLSQASPAEGLTISPPIFEINLRPGEITKRTIQITNPTKNLIELYPSSMDFGAAGEGGQPTFAQAGDENNRFSMAKWISFDTPKVALLPEQVVEFNFEIHVPEDPEPGGHYGVVFLATEPPKPQGQASQVALASKVGSLLLLRLPGDVNEKGSIEEFSTPWFYFSPPVNFNTFIRNSGNIHFKPKGEVAIRNWRGKELERIPLNPVNGNILPDSRRKFDLKWAPETSPFWKIPVGRFSADLRFVYGQSEQTLDNKIYFWIIPWWLIIFFSALLLLLIIFIFWRLIKRRRKKRNRNTNQYQSFSYPRKNSVQNMPTYKQETISRPKLNEEVMMREEESFDKEETKRKNVMRF